MGTLFSALFYLIFYYKHVFNFINRKISGIYIYV